MYSSFLRSELHFPSTLWRKMFFFKSTLKIFYPYLKPMSTTLRYYCHREWFPAISPIYAFHHFNDLHRIHHLSHLILVLKWCQLLLGTMGTRKSFIDTYVTSFGLTPSATFAPRKTKQPSLCTYPPCVREIVAVPVLLYRHVPWASCPEGQSAATWGRFHWNMGRLRTLHLQSIKFNDPAIRWRSCIFLSMSFKAFINYLFKMSLTVSSWVWKWC